MGKQCEFAVDACKKLPKIRVSVNVRPDELPGVKEFLMAKAAETKVAETGISNLLIEITEYAPITEATIALIRDMKSNGVVFAIDDVTQVQENPGKAMAKPGTHACSIELAVKHADLFQVQKLSMSMSCSAFRVEVFPTPVWAGGKAQPFLKGMIFPEDQVEEIQTRKELVEKWVADVLKKNEKVQFVIECSVYEEDVEKNKWAPEIGLFDGLLVFREDYLVAEHSHLKHFYSEYSDGVCAEGKQKKTSSKKNGLTRWQTKRPTITVLWLEEVTTKAIAGP